MLKSKSKSVENNYVMKAIYNTFYLLNKTNFNYNLYLPACALISTKEA